MKQLNKQMHAVGGIMLFAGIILTFGAVGGMDDPTKVDWFWAQLATAAVGVFWMWVGAGLLSRESDCE